MTLRTTEYGIELIEAFEGFHATPYKCPAGVWTVGYGHTSVAGPPKIVTVNAPILTMPEAVAVLRSDIDGFETQIEKLVTGMSLTANQFDALVSFGFNAGVGNLAASTLLKKLKAGDTAGAAAQFARWNKFHNPATGETEESPGLTRRRRAESALFLGDLTDAQTYMGMDFGPMPQAVAQPEPPKGMSQSKTGNSSLVGAIGTAALGAKAMISAAQPTVSQVTEVTQQAQTVATQVQGAVQQTQQTVQAAQGAVRVVHTFIPHVAPHVMLAHVAPWALLTLVVTSALTFVWYDRRKKLVEEGV